MAAAPIVPSWATIAIPRSASEDRLCSSDRSARLPVSSDTVGTALIRIDAVVARGNSAVDIGLIGVALGLAVAVAVVDSVAVAA